MLRFEVKALGRVVSADVELAPLTILVGKNNTGKSYLATLIWTLASPAVLLEADGFRRKPAWFTRLVAPLGDEAVRVAELTPAEVSAMISAVERTFNRKAAEILSSVFAVDGFESTKVKLGRSNVDGIQFSLERYNRKTSPDDDIVSQVEFYVSINGRKRIIYSVKEDWLAESWLSDLFFQEILGHCLFGESWRAYRRETYIPAARTGIMLALPALVSQSFGSPGSETAIGLPRPLSQFLGKMAERGTARRFGHTPVRDRLREKLLRGQITAPKEAVSDFRYTPEGVDVELPLYAASSMITELAPFLVALNNEAGTHHFIFEEPEAHLHLEAQREMARLIARLVSAGTPVTLTTHSDTFLQQINNLMVLAQHPRREEMMTELGYEAEDLIDPRLAMAYEFCPEQDGTYVRAVENTPDGFVIPTLNSTLLALANETLALRSGRDA